MTTLEAMTGAQLVRESPSVFTLRIRGRDVARYELRGEHWRAKRLTRSRLPEVLAWIEAVRLSLR